MHQTLTAHGRVKPLEVTPNVIKVDRVVSLKALWASGTPKASWSLKSSANLHRRMSPRKVASSGAMKRWTCLQPSTIRIGAGCPWFLIIDISYCDSEILRLSCVYENKLHWIAKEREEQTETEKARKTTETRRPTYGGISNTFIKMQGSILEDLWVYTWCLIPAQQSVKSEAVYQ